MQATADVVIIGAGAIGCSTAYHLAQMGITDVVVVEMGQVGSGSSSKSASMLSLQFGHDLVNAAMAKVSYGRYMQFEQEIGVPIDFRKTGWLSVATEESAAELLESVGLLGSLDITTEVLQPAEVKQRYPQVNTEDLALATYGPDDGPFDPHMILWGYARRAGQMGVRLQQGVQATGIALQSGRVAGVETTAGFVSTPIVINAAGPWAEEVGRWVGVEIPLLNRARTILVTGTLPQIPRDMPFVEDVGREWYFRPEGDGVLMGMGMEPVNDVDRPATDPALVDAIIDAAVHRVPVLAQASVLTTWTGVRPLTPDNRPILGAVPGVQGFLLNCGWGGVGIIQAPVAGQLLAELATAGRTTTFDIAPFRLGRFTAF